MVSKVQAIRQLLTRSYMTMDEAKKFIEDVMALGAEDYRVSQKVDAGLAAIEKLRDHGEA